MNKIIIALCFFIFCCSFSFCRIEMTKEELTISICQSTARFNKLERSIIRKKDNSNIIKYNEEKSILQSLLIEYEKQYGKFRYNECKRNMK